VEAYFRRPERRLVEDGLLEEFTLESGSQRLAGKAEERGNFLKALINAIFFQHFVALAGAGETITAQTGYQLWPFQPIALRINSVRFNLVVAFSYRNRIFLDSSWRLIRNQSKIGLRILFRCFCAVPPSFALQIVSWTGSWRLRTLCSWPCIFGTMAGLLAIHCFRDRRSSAMISINRWTAQDEEGDTEAKIRQLQNRIRRQSGILYQVIFISFIQGYSWEQEGTS